MWSTSIFAVTSTVTIVLSKLFEYKLRFMIQNGQGILMFTIGVLVIGFLCSLILSLIKYKGLTYGQKLVPFTLFIASFLNAPPVTDWSLQLQSN